MRSSIVRCSLVITLISTVTWAQVPAKMSYQGVLTGASGVPVADGSHSLVFKLYNVSSGGASLWTETQGSVQTNNGVLSVVLGSVTPIGIAFDGPLWLGIAVDGGAELSPRVELTTSPYAFQAKSVNDDAVTSVTIADGAVTSADIADGTVTGADIADGTVAGIDIADGTLVAADIAAGQIVTSVNSLNDAVTLAAGANVTITPAGNTLTFAASSSAANTLDMAYDQGGAGVGRTITADAGAVDITGTGGLTVAGDVGIGTTTPNNLLSVNESAAANTFLQVTNSATGTTGTDGTLLGIDASGNSALVNQEATDLDLYTSNTPRLKIKANGDVGIGTTSPAQKLHISGNLRLDDGANDNTISGGVAGIGSINFRNNATTGMTFDHTERFIWNISGAEKMRIDNSGNIGIGTSGPRVPLDIVKATTGAGQILQVGSLSFYKDATPTIAADIGMNPVGGALTDDLIFSMYNGSWFERMRIANGGNVGIGTTAPSNNLHVKDTAAATVGLTLEGPSFISGIDHVATGLRIGHNSGLHNMEFQTASTTRMTIHQQGMVGIGTTSPASKLSVDLGNASNLTDELRVTGSGSETSLGLRNTSAGGRGYQILSTGTGSGLGAGSLILYDLTEGGNTGHRLVVNSAGNVGIGTASPTAKLEVAGDLLVGGPTAANKAVYSSQNAHLRLLSGDTGGGALLFEAGTPGVPTEHMRIDGATGNVGIGTAAPTRKLHVVGDVEFVGSIFNTYTSTSGTGDSPGGYSGVTAQGTNRSLLLQGASGGTVWIDVNGNVAVGFSAPAPTERLSVAGNVAPNSDNTYTSGTATNRWSDVYAVSGTVNTSDRRLKENIEDSPYGLKQVLDLHPVSYTWKDRPERGKKLGLIAQEVQPVIREVVHVGDDPDETLGLYYSDLVPVLVKAIQEQQELIQAENAALRTELRQTRAMVESMAAELKVLQSERMTRSKPAVVDAG